MIDPLAPDSKVAWSFGLTAFLSHVTFLFGLFPSQAVTSPLPDWSLGLEAQYYAIFPLIMLLWKRGAVLLFTISTYVVALICKRLFGLGMGEGATEGLLHYTFPMATLLGLKITTFLVGMLLAEAMFKLKESESYEASILLVLAGSICGLQNNRLLLVLYTIMAACAFAGTERSGIMRKLDNLLKREAFAFFGDISYPIYLTHQLVLLPLCAVAIRFGWFTALSPAVRFLLSGLMIVPIVIAASYALHRLIEKPGIQLGRWLLYGK